MIGVNECLNCKVKLLHFSKTSKILIRSKNTINLEKLSLLQKFKFITPFFRKKSLWNCSEYFHQETGENVINLLQYLLYLSSKNPRAIKPVRAKLINVKLQLRKVQISINGTVRIKICILITCLIYRSSQLMPIKFVPSRLTWHRFQN